MGFSARGLGGRARPASPGSARGCGGAPSSATQAGVQASGGAESEGVLSRVLGQGEQTTKKHRALTRWYFLPRPKSGA